MLSWKTLRIKRKSCMADQYSYIWFIGFDMCFSRTSGKSSLTNSCWYSESSLSSCDNISIFHVCMVWIQKSVTWVTDRHHEACRVMPNSDPEWQIFLSTPYTHDRYFFLHTFWWTTFDFQSRTCYEITLSPLKGFYLSLIKSTLPATAFRFFTLTSDLHKVTSFLT